MADILKRLDREFDVAETFENIDRYASSALEEGAHWRYDGDTYEVEEHGRTDDGEYYIAGNKV